MQDEQGGNGVMRRQAHAINRRRFMQGLAAAGMSAGVGARLIGAAGAQTASPMASPGASPVAYDGPVGTLSIDRAAYNTALRDHFAFEEPGATGGTFIYASTADIATLNPILSSDSYSSMIIGLVMEQLVATSPLDGSWVPALADSWEIAADGVTYTFHLHEGVTWHDGEPFSADDVIFTFDAVMNPDSLSPRTGEVSSVLASYRAIDEHTVELVAKAPVATFLDKTVGEFAILPKHIWEQVPVGEMGSDPGSTGSDPARVIGTGPFTFGEWVQADHVAVARNPSYWDAANTPVSIDEFVYRVVGDAGTAQQSLVTGESDAMTLSASAAVSLQKSNPEITQTDYDTFGFTFFAGNQDPAKSDLFLDREVRQALMYGLDRDLFIETVLQGYGTRADGTQPVPSPAYDPSRVNTIYTYDPDKARSLLAEAGWVAGDGGTVAKNGKDLSFECQYPDNNPAYEQLMAYMQEAWKEIGVEMTPVLTPFQTLIENAMGGNFEMVILGSSWGVDPDQSEMFASSSLPPNGFNFFHWHNDRYDELIPLQNRELDVAKRIDMIIEQSNLVNDDAAVGMLAFSRSIVGAGERVHNYFPNAYSEQGIWSVPFVWLAGE